MTPERIAEIKELRDRFRSMPTMVPPVVVDVLDELLDSVAVLLFKLHASQVVIEAEWEGRLGKPDIFVGRPPAEGKVTHAGRLASPKTCTMLPLCGDFHPGEGLSRGPENDMLATCADCRALLPTSGKYLAGPGQVLWRVGELREVDDRCYIMTEEGPQRFPVRASEL